MSNFAIRSTKATANIFLVGAARASAIALCAKYKGTSEIVDTKNGKRYRFSFNDKSHATKFVDEFDKAYTKATASKPAPTPKPTPEKKKSKKATNGKGSAPNYKKALACIKGKGKGANSQATAILRELGYAGTYGTPEWDYWRSIR